MFVYDNDDLIKRRAWLGKYASIIGLGVLAAGLLSSFKPEYTYISFGCLVLGFILSQVGTYNASRFSRSPRQHERLEKVLKGLDDRYYLFNYLFPAAHVLVGPHGMLVLRLKDQAGEVFYANGRWRQKFSVMRGLAAFGSEGLGNPVREVEDEVRMLTRFLEKRDPDLASLPVEGLAVFLNPQATLVMDDSDLPVVRAKQLKQALKDPERRKRMNNEDRKALVEFLEQEIGADDDEEEPLDGSDLPIEDEVEPESTPAGGDD